MKGLKDLTDDTRKTAGQIANDVKIEIEAALQSKNMNCHKLFGNSPEKSV